MKQIKISEVIDLLNQGKKRNEIATHYGLTMGEVKEIFQHPLLKGKKARIKRKERQFQIIDDLSGENSEVTENPVTTGDSLIGVNVEPKLGEPIEFD